MLYELHVWGPIGNLPSFDPDCLIAILYLKVVNDQEDHFKVIASNNPVLSKEGHLPVIRRGEEIMASGIEDVLRYMKKTIKNIESGLEPLSRAQSISLAAFIAENLKILSLYIERLHGPHFQAFFRPGVVSLLSFPIQYYVPIQLFTEAKHQISHFYNVDDTKDYAKVSGESTVPGISFFKKYSIRSVDLDRSIPATLVDKLNAYAGGASEFSGMLRMLNLACNAYQVIEDSIKDDESPYIFGETPSIADLYLISHLAVETFPDYTVPFLRDLLESRFPRLNKYFNTHKQLLSEVKSIVNLNAESKDRYSILGIAKWYLNYQVV
ncbi:outer mitochondrial membrane transport complex protein-domain-containing protein [Dipodascopsis uninucleata]